MAMMNRADIRKQLQEGLNAVFGLEYRRHKPQWTELFEVETSRKAYEEDVLMFGLGAVPNKGEGAPVMYDQGGESYVSRYKHLTYALAFAITEEALEDGLYGNLGSKMSKAMARSFQHTKELVHANIFNRGFDSNFTGGDGKPLFSTTHPLAGGGTLANTFATPADLTESALEAAGIIIDDWVDERGLPIDCTIKKLAIPTDLRYVATRLLMSPYRPGTSDNDVNAINTNGTISQGYCVNHRFTSDKAWFLTTDIPDGLKHFRRVKMSVKIEGDFETGNMRYRGRERYSAGWSNFRGAFGSAGTGG